MKKAVLFITFNRLDYVKESFAQIRKAKPPRLYVASDGPRECIVGEAEVVQSVRDYIINNIDWDCEVHTRFLDKNSGGCAYGVSGAVTWFFEKEEDGIILEDDCVPSQSFFRYCETLLDKYKNNKKVWHIGGDAVCNDISIKSSYYFAKIQHCWGWASWADRWKHYKLDLQEYDRKNLKKFSKRPEVQAYWSGKLDKMQYDPGYTWDYQWAFIIVANNGYCINPVKNLIKNIGIVGEHYSNSNSNNLQMETYEIDKIKHPLFVRYNYEAIDKIYKTRFKIKEKNKSKNEKIPIFMASDDNYAPFLASAIYSVLENTKSYINFYILDGGISKNSKNLIKKSLLKFKNHTIKYIDMSKFKLDRFPEVRHYSRNTFSRYFIPVVMPKISKCLYLDVDIVVKGDVKNLYNVNLEGCALAAVPEDFYRKNGEYVKENIEPSFDNTEKYFNAGIMVLNNKKFVNNNYSEKLVETTLKYYDKLSCVDQDVFNIVFEHDHVLMDYKYNYMPDLYNNYNTLKKGLGDRLEKDAVILHYTCWKPWKDDKAKRKEDFWRAIRKTYFGKTVLKKYHKSMKTSAYLFGFIKLPKSYRWSILRKSSFKHKYLKNEEINKKCNTISICDIPVLMLKTK